MVVFLWNGCVFSCGTPVCHGTPCIALLVISCQSHGGAGHLDPLLARLQHCNGCQACFSAALQASRPPFTHTFHTTHTPHTIHTTQGSTVSTKYGNVSTDHVLFIASGAFHQAKPSDMLAELQVVVVCVLCVHYVVVCVNCQRRLPPGQSQRHTGRAAGG